MLALKGRQDGFKLTLPDDFIPSKVNEKYSKILQAKRSFITKPIDFLNETVQKVEVLGFNNASVAQQQQGLSSKNTLSANILKNHTASDFNYRSSANPISLIDKTINITFRHTLGYINYFILFESFLQMYERETKYKSLPKYIQIDLLDETGAIYFKLLLEGPIIDGIDMLTFDNTQPVAQSQTFNLVVKYSNLDYQLVNPEYKNWNGETEI